MIISTSSYNVQLTNLLRDYVDKTLQRELGQVARHVVSVDVQLEAVQASSGREDTQAIMRVDLRNGQVLITEYRASNLYTAVRQSALESARKIRRQTPQSVQAREQWLPAALPAFSRYSAPNV